MPEVPTERASPEPLRRRVRTSLLRGLARAPEPLVRGALEAAAGLARWSRYDTLCRDNLELALGDELSPSGRARLARRVRAHAARQLREWLRLARLGARDDSSAARWLEERVELDRSVERLDQVEAAGRGLLIATAHLGNWELLAARLRLRGHRGAVVGRRRRRDSSSDWLIEARARLGVATLAQDEPARRALRILRDGGTLGLLSDLAVPRLDGVELPFFRHPARTMTAPAALARAARTPLVPVRCVLRRDRYRLLVDPPLALDDTLERRAATRALLGALNATYERWIREDPEQWAWHQPRWGRAPQSGLAFK